MLPPSKSLFFPCILFLELVTSTLGRSASKCYTCGESTEDFDCTKNLTEECNEITAAKDMAKLTGSTLEVLQNGKSEPEDEEIGDHDPNKEDEDAHMEFVCHKVTKNKIVDKGCFYKNSEIKLECMDLKYLSCFCDTNLCNRAGYKVTTGVINGGCVALAHLLAANFLAL